MPTSHLTLQPAGGGFGAVLSRRGTVARGWRGRLAQADWSPDLAEDIGSARWFRGLATLLGLTGLALALWPDFSALPARPATPLDPAARTQLRALALSALPAARNLPAEAVFPLADAPQRTALHLGVTLAAGDSLAALLARSGADPADAARAQHLVVAALGGTQPAAGTRIDVTLGQAAPADGGRALARLALRARFDLDLAVVRGAGGLALAAHRLAIDTTPLRIRGAVGASLYQSARVAGAPIAAIQQYLQALDQHLSLDTAIEPGDTFDIVVAQRRAADGQVQVGELLYGGLERAGRPKAQLLRWGGEGQYFEASGMGAQRTGLIMPVVGRITSNFGARRHPVLGYTRLHAGVDFGAPYGSPIYAVGDGTVNYAGWHGGHGNYVRLDHGGGYGTGYAHMSRLAVSPGSRVRAGQVIGYVGSTGLSTGPHLHYELYRGGVPVNPLTVRFTVSAQVDSGELAAFRARLAQVKAVRVGSAAVAAVPVRAASGPAVHREIDKLGN